jgi:hypothetical protein
MHIRAAPRRHAICSLTAPLPLTVAARRPQLTSDHIAQVIADKNYCPGPHAAPKRPQRFPQ